MNGKTYLVGVLMGVVIGFNVCNLVNLLAGITYKDGQIDALIGNVKYQLVKQKDGTTEWEYISK